MRIWGLLKNKIFEYQLEKQRRKAQKEYDKKQDVVMCKYCKQLIKKKEAGLVYDFETKEIEFFHEKCFNENEYIGTIDDLLREE